MNIEIAPTETSCEVSLQGGHKVVLTFRPFNLADVAWMQHNFDTDEKRLKLASMSVDEVSQLIWHMLTPESKSTFSNIKFQEYDEERECEIEVKITGYKKLQYALASQEDLIKLFATYSQSESLNSFIPSAHKKKVKTTPK